MGKLLSLYIYYDANNNKTSELYQTWDGSAWVNGYLNTFTYDANNNLASEFAAIVECQY